MCSHVGNVEIVGTPDRSLAATQAPTPTCLALFSNQDEHAIVAANPNRCDIDRAHSLCLLSDGPNNHLASVRAFVITVQQCPWSSLDFIKFLL
jgi:hypothetical protein